jgi:hypothetical protein
VGTRAGLKAVVKRKFPAPARNRTPDHPARSPALYITNPVVCDCVSFQNTIISDDNYKTESKSSALMLYLYTTLPVW